MKETSMHIALLYFGKSRSIRHTYKTHQTHVFNKLKGAGITYDTYMHVWDSSDNMVWNRESGVPEDEDSYALLEPTYFKKEDQQEFLDVLDFGQYFYESVYRARGECANGEWIPQLVRNHICALESQRRVFQMTEETGVQYDAYIVIRPDAYFVSDLDIELLQTVQPNTLYVPEWMWFEGYNDRLAFGCKEVIQRYTNRIADFPEFRRTRGRVVAEKYLKLTVEKYGFAVKPLQVRFRLCRPSGALDA
jgi:hypothetical protein